MDILLPSAGSHFVALKAAEPSSLYLAPHLTHHCVLTVLASSVKHSLPQLPPGSGCGSSEGYWVREAEKHSTLGSRSKSNFVELRKCPELQEGGDRVLLRPRGAWNISADLAENKYQGPGTGAALTNRSASWRQLYGREAQGGT